MLSRFFSQLLKLLGGLLFVVLLVLVGWLLPDLFDLSSNSSGRQKRMSAEGQFFTVLFIVLLIIGVISWLVWHHMKAH